MRRARSIALVVGCLACPPTLALAQDAPPVEEAAEEVETAVAEVEEAPEAPEPPAPSTDLAVPPPPAAGEELVAPPPPMMNQGPQPATQAEVALLDAWLDSFDGKSRTLRYISAPLGILAGGALTGLGVWYITDDSFSLGSREAAVGLGAGMITLGSLAVVVGIYNFVVPTYPEEIYARFTTAREDGLTARQLGRFEGELLALAEMSRMARYASIISGFAMALGGGIAIAVSATVDRDDPRTIGVAVGGGLAIAGAIIGGMSFIPSPYERAWEKYDAGLGPDGTAPTVQAAPLLGPDTAGVSVAGTF